jgi:vesicle coat complex subunit
LLFHRALTDPSAYVRKTGVMGILKLYHLAPDMVKGSNMIDLLYNMIQDPDSQVMFVTFNIHREGRVWVDRRCMGWDTALWTGCSRLFKAACVCLCV